jgi:UDP-N-acetylglucosamine 2-epimerase (non-hydrolysing)
MKKLLICFGTRPEWLKILPIVRTLPREKYLLLFTGQHEDLIENLEVDHRIHIGEADNRLDSIISSCMVQFPQGDFFGVLVQGDTASAFGCSLAAYNRKIKIFYLEAGLRSGDMNNPYPEEAFRQMISRISDVNFCPTNLSKNNLEKENVGGSSYVVGNTVLDNLLPFKRNQEYDNTILVTMHRRENHKLIPDWFSEIDNISSKYKDLKFILPLHPNPNVSRYRHLLKSVDVVNPLPHYELINILARCKLVITDSGGLQEEGSFFNKKVIVCRKTTERPEGIDTGHIHLCKSPDMLTTIFELVNRNHVIEAQCPYGDGNSSKQVYKILKEQYGL